MGQAPGTHWYHAHVHGSTALNVANGLAGAFIIEGPYDDALRAFYKNASGPGLEEKVLVIQQLSTSLGLLSATRFGPPFLSVNGRRQPVITMRPGQVQMWRIVNGAYRSFVQFRNFTRNHHLMRHQAMQQYGDALCGLAADGAGWGAVRSG